MDFKFGFQALDQHRLAPFLWPDLSSVTLLEELRVDSNSITEISPTALQGMANLWTLRLQRNRLSYILAGPLDGLTNLQFLRLNYNEITGVEDLVRQLRHYSGTIPALFGTFGALFVDHYSRGSRFCATTLKRRAMCRRLAST